MKTVHEKVKYNCDKCHKSFLAKHVLIDHKKTVHEGKWFKCELCKKELSSKFNLKLHLKRVHSVEKRKLIDEEEKPKPLLNEDSKVSEPIFEPKEPKKFKRGTWIVKLERIDDKF